MPPRDRNDDDTPPTTAAFLRTLDERQLSDLISMSRWYANLRPEVRKVFYNAESETLDWLARARAEEIAQLKAGIELMETFKARPKMLKFLRETSDEQIELFSKTAKLADGATTLGRFILYCLLTAAAALVAGGTVADWWFKKKGS